MKGDLQFRGLPMGAGSKDRGSAAMLARRTVPRVRLEAGVRGAPRTLVHIAGVDIEPARRHLGSGLFKEKKPIQK